MFAEYRKAVAAFLASAAAAVLAVVGAVNTWSPQLVAVLTGVATFVSGLATYFVKNDPPAA
jgi:predicted exporter